MEPYHIKHQHQKTANHSEHCAPLAVPETQTLNTYTMKPVPFQWAPILNLFSKWKVLARVNELHERICKYLNDELCMSKVEYLTKCLDTSIA